MHTAEAKPVSVAEAKSLFNHLASLPALVLAVSGGPDSTALMLLAARWAQSGKRKPKLVAVTIDHGLRPESKREALAVKRLARALGIEHRILRWIGKKPATGLQEAARLARYRLLADAARKVGTGAILTAHTLDDQAETVLMRLARGSGITGLGAMRRTAPLAMHGRTPSPLEGEGWGVLQLSRLPPSRRASRVDLPLKGGGDKERPEVCLIRPLLDIPKSRLLATLTAAKIPFVEDPSNNDPRFTRVRVRKLMPALAQEGLTAERFRLLGKRLRRADQALDAMADAALTRLVRPQGRARVMSAVEFAGLSKEIRLRLLGRALDSVADGPVALGKLESLQEALDAALAAKNPRFRRSLAGGMVTLCRGEIVVEPAPPRRHPKKP
ncbi:MAG TPA: tRNA lysidine(34) synthetase TilS [Pseudolabrys sp.]|nr:tRNA lysidine(34) synthetase TilS [Pseudolabrys sp.]